MQQDIFGLTSRNGAYDLMKVMSQCFCYNGGNHTVIDVLETHTTATPVTSGTCIFVQNDFLIPMCHFPFHDYLFLA